MDCSGRDCWAYLLGMGKSMTGYQSKKAAALDEEGMYLVHHTKSRVFDKLGNKVKEDDDDTQVYADALTIAYQSGYYDGKKAAQPVGQAPCAKHCESTAYEIVIRGFKGDIERLEAAQRTEPVGCVADIDRLQRQMFLDLGYSLSDPLYTTPPAAQPAQRQWVGLDKKDKWEIVEATERDDRNHVMALVEAKLKEKNT